MVGALQETDPRKRVVITGWGAFFPKFGCDLNEISASLAAGESGITLLDTNKYPFISDLDVKIGGAVPDSKYDPTDYATAKEIKRSTPAVILTYAAMLRAIVDAGLIKHISDIPKYSDAERAKILEDRDFRWLGTKYLSRRVGALVGTAVGGSPSMIYDKLDVFTIPKLNLGQIVSNPAINLDMRGPTLPIVAACTSSIPAFGMAAEQIRSGRADIMLAGGGENSFYEVGFAAFSRMGALSTRNHEPEKASRPLDASKEYRGFVMSQGSAIGVLESLASAQERGATIYAEVLDYGLTTDASHATHPHIGGIKEAMLISLERSGLIPRQVKRLLLHATSTDYDWVEATAAHDLFGDNPDITIGTPKSMVGHMQGAASAAALLQGCLEMRARKAFPSINLDNRIPQIGNMNVPTIATPQEPGIVMVNGLGVGGVNGSILIRPFAA